MRGWVGWVGYRLLSSFLSVHLYICGPNLCLIHLCSHHARLSVLGKNRVSSVSSTIVASSASFTHFINQDVKVPLRIFRGQSILIYVLCIRLCLGYAHSCMKNIPVSVTLYQSSKCTNTILIVMTVPYDVTFCWGVSGFAIDCPCGVWCHGLTTCLLHVGPPFGNRILKNSWAVGLT